ncbi:MAG: sigma 54-interacting transcriptional regulator [Lachnospiraceae bacterium]|nr:sigma 54-interacting transcriptional regulator [Lachnospiraceae bacterium]
MNQYLSIKKVKELFRKITSTVDTTGCEKEVNEINHTLDKFLDKGIDFKEIVDSLDDSIFITDKDGKVLYANPAYEKNTGISLDRVIDHYVNDLIHKDHLYSGGAIPYVLKYKKSCFRLSTTYAQGKPLKGYAAGTPLFDDNGNLYQVVACSRPIVSLSSLKEDFNAFISEVEQIKPQKIDTKAESNLSPEMVGRNTTLSSLWSIIKNVAPSDATVLITGESGSGKEVIADEIYKNSKRNKQPFIKINCASIPAHLIESELFGYKKGAFSGANANGKPGLFEMANNGTLLLDEIGDMPMDLQVKLLRAIQSQEITRVGDTTPIHLNIRFLASTNSDLKQKIAEGTFRQDLYYRLNVIPLYVPPLRERKDDIEELCNTFIERFSTKYELPFSLTKDQIKYLQRYNWPGNIRELENIIEYLVLCSAGNGVCDDSILYNLLDISSEGEVTHSASNISHDFNSAVEEFEKQYLENTLRNCRTLREAGDRLGLNASTISRKIRQYNIDYDGIRR